LGKIGVSQADQESLNNAWLKLRDRRHRIPSADETELAHDTI
jgi:hypothetical protein